MTAEQISTLVADLKIRECTAELCARLEIYPLADRKKCKQIMETMLDVAIEGWLSAKALGG